MKTILALLTAAAACLPALAADEPYKPGDWAVAGFGTYRVAGDRAATLDNRFGGGVEVSYFLRDKVCLSLEALTDHAVDEVGLNLKRYFPIKDFFLTPYGFVGATRAFETEKAGGDLRVNLGLGVELPLGKNFCVFGDARWTHDFDVLEHGLVRFGGRLSF